jgi:hypothetical protein
MLSLILFLLGIICIVSGNTIMSSDDCNKNVDIRIVPRHVYDEVVSNSTL